MTRRVVVTGIGPVTPVGSGRRDFWASLTAGRSGIGPITHFDPANLPSRIAGQVKDFENSPHLGPQQARKIDRFAQLALEAAWLAFDDAGLKPADLEPSRAGAVVGSAYGGAARVETEAAHLLASGPRAVLPQISVSSTPSAAAAFVSIEFGLRGPVECVAAACASGAQAVSRGFDLIRLGAAEVMLAGGTDAAVTPLFMAAFCSARALSRRNDDPAAASRPFDAARDGFVFSEGAVLLVLEEAGHAAARGAPVLAEVMGYGHSADAYSLASPHPDGDGAVLAMQVALASAGVTPAEIGYVNAHAASTPAGDVAEVRALRRIFGENLPPVSSTKSMTGHLLGAAGALEAAATTMTIASGQVPPTINVESLDPECDIDVVANKGRPEQVAVAISNSFGLGGLNCTIVFAKC
jgi:3-oxoacyl-[acyl-carrier-protein] synthase II